MLKNSNSQYINQTNRNSRQQIQTQATFFPKHLKIKFLFFILLIGMNEKHLTQKILKISIWQESNISYTNTFFYFLCVTYCCLLQKN